VLIIVARAVATMQLNVGSGFEILENSFGGGEMAGEMAGIVEAKCSSCK